ncbi:hypothetical protein BS78_04G163500 [Paspalum vaginatum]|nr:hypothetical protein BS78_04G163500 [Paspalum vaginatum]
MAAGGGVRICLRVKGIGREGGNHAPKQARVTHRHQLKTQGQSNPRSLHARMAPGGRRGRELRPSARKIGGRRPRRRQGWLAAAAESAASGTGRGGRGDGNPILGPVRAGLTQRSGHGLTGCVSQPRTWFGLGPYFFSLGIGVLKFNENGFLSRYSFRPVKY